MLQIADLHENCGKVRINRKKLTLLSIRRIRRIIEKIINELWSKFLKNGYSSRYAWISWKKEGQVFEKNVMKSNVHCFRAIERKMEAAQVVGGRCKRNAFIPVTKSTIYPRHD